MSLTRPIPLHIRQKFNADPWYAKCCIADAQCSGRIEFHHNFTFAGKRTDDEEGILPACSYHHSKADTTLIKERFDWVMLSRSLTTLDQKYARSGLNQRYKYLATKKYD